MSFQKQVQCASSQILHMPISVHVHANLAVSNDMSVCRSAVTNLLIHGNIVVMRSV